MGKTLMHLPIVFATTCLTLALEGCQNLSLLNQATPRPTPAIKSPLPLPATITSVAPADHQTLLLQSWAAYRERFIQADGRVIDREADDRSTSEGQAYAMLRAVMVGDRNTFDRTLQWAENNLQRQTNGKRSDHLWAWKWGRNSQGVWGILDGNFASDADIDAVTALIFAARRWQDSAYLNLARTKLNDLWNLSTVTAFPTDVQVDDRRKPRQREPFVPGSSPLVSPPYHPSQAGNPSRYLLPGPTAAFQQSATVQINPSYFAPYAFRLFAQVDPTHDWLSLVNSSYEILQQAARLSSVGLPNDWVVLDLKTGSVKPLTIAKPGTSDYSFDAYRVWWRVAWDAAWFKEPRAIRYLQTQLKFPQRLWRSQRKIPARINLQGKPTVTYEATAQYAMLYAAFQLIDPPIAQQIEATKLTPRYQQGFWDNDSAYYTQNLVWIGLLPPDGIMPLLQPN